VFGLPVYTVAGAALMGTFITSFAGVGFYMLIAPWYPDQAVSPDWLLGLLFGLGGMGGMYLGARAQKFVPAKLIKEFRKTSEKPILKAAYVEESIYIGDDQLNALSIIKSREELIGDLILLLQSPARNVLSALQSGNTKLAGIVKTLSEKE
jgi:hypothetical protein